MFSSEDKLSAPMAKQSIKSLLLLMSVRLKVVEDDTVKMKLQFHCHESKQAAIRAMPFSFQQMETETFGSKHQASISKSTNLGITLVYPCTFPKALDSHVTFYQRYNNNKGNISLQDYV